ncbi:hypothetical protein ACFX2H_019788 [Malus domestica]
MNTSLLTSSSCINPSTSAAAAKPKPSFLNCHARKATKISCRPTNCYEGGSTSHTNFYKLLSLSPNTKTSKDKIKRAYRSMALRYHPDVCHDQQNSNILTERFVQLNEAYKTLSDPLLRDEYDYELGLKDYCNNSCSRRSTFTYSMDNSVRNNQGAQNRWSQQILELKRRSQKEGSWASRMRRARDISNH